MEFFRKIFKDKKNYYNILVIIFLGVLLLMFSNSFAPEEAEIAEEDLYETNIKLGDTYEEKLELRLEEVLSKVVGVGEVEVMITTENDGELITKSDSITEHSVTNEKSENGDTREIQSNKYQDSTVKIQDDAPLILQEVSPKIQGVLIVAEGGGNIEIKNSLINATNALLGVDLHKIEVLTMK